MTKKNKLEEVIKPRGFERGLPLDKIVGVTNCKNELMFLLKWHDCPEYDLVRAIEVNENCPEVVIEYYEARCPLMLKCVTNGKSEEKYEADLAEQSQSICENIEEHGKEIKTQIADTNIISESDITEGILDLKTEINTSGNSTCENDVVNGTFDINIDNTNSVQVSYSLPLIENQPGEDLMETVDSTDLPDEQDTNSHKDTSSCHMPNLQDVEM